MNVFMHERFALINRQPVFLTPTVMYQPLITASKNKSIFAILILSGSSENKQISKALDIESILGR